MFTRTKIICTIGPATSELKTMQRMYAAGMNVVRINMSHASHEEALNVIKNVKLINKKSDIKMGPISVLIDTQGPEIRTGDRETSLDLKLGDKVNLTVRDEVDVETSSIKINYRGLIDSVKKGSRISVDNGLINFKVLEKHDEKLLCKVIDGGKIGSKRSVNLPGVRIDLPSITKKDKIDINFAIKYDVDYIALSFVRKIEDINIGETVYAIGNPQGLGQSVSMGIISAIGRKFINKEGSFIQTDASINPGNSGGALVDSNGNLLGVINFIESTTGGNQGLNFAIPIDVVSDSYSEILKETIR